jgi:hypothetical protein
MYTPGAQNFGFFGFEKSILPVYCINGLSASIRVVPGRPDERQELDNKRMRIEKKPIFRMIPRMVGYQGNNTIQAGKIQLAVRTLQPPKNGTGALSSALGTEGAPEKAQVTHQT